MLDGPGYGSKRGDGCLFYFVIPLGQMLEGLLFTGTLLIDFTQIDCQPIGLLQFSITLKQQRGPFFLLPIPQPGMFEEQVAASDQQLF